jgi:DNA polymerase IV
MIEGAWDAAGSIYFLGGAFRRPTRGDFCPDLPFSADGAATKTGKRRLTAKRREVDKSPDKRSRHPARQRAKSSSLDGGRISDCSCGSCACDASSLTGRRWASAAAIIEPLSLDEAYLDLSPGIRLVDRAPALLLARLQRAIEERIGVTVTVGLSYNKALAKLASGTNKPRGFTVIGRAEAKQVLAALPVTAIHGVGAATARRMAASDITTIAQLQAMPEADLAARFGKFGRRLAQLVQGEDPRPVEPDRATKSISSETTFARDLSGYEPLAAELKELVQRLEQRLARTGLAGATVVLKLKTADFRSFTRQSRLAHPTRRGDIILAHGERLLRREVDGRAFRLIGIGVGSVTEAAEADQPELFSL